MVLVFRQIWIRGQLAAMSLPVTTMTDDNLQTGIPMLDMDSETCLGFERWMIAGWSRKRAGERGSHALCGGTMCCAEGRTAIVARCGR
jgi:hypothetical protein